MSRTLKERDRKRKERDRKRKERDRKRKDVPQKERRTAKDVTVCKGGLLAGGVIAKRSLGKKGERWKK